MSVLLPSETVKTGIDLLGSGHGKAAWGVGGSADRGEALRLKLMQKQLHHLIQGFSTVDQVFTCVAQDGGKGSRLFKVSELFHIPQVHGFFADGEGVAVMCLSL